MRHLWVFVAGMQAGYIAWRLWPDWWTSVASAWPIPLEVGFLGFLLIKAGRSQ